MMALMGMYDAIKNFAEQFAYQPVIENRRYFRSIRKYIVAGMGGSNLAAGLIKIWNPYLDVVLHRDYELPVLAEKELRNAFVIAISYSGNTEETISSFNQAMEKKLPLAAVATGGTLLELARRHKVPYIQLPDIHIQPRMALGFSAKALLAFMNQKNGLEEIDELADALKPVAYELAGKKLAQRLIHKIPVIYASAANEALAYIWKIKLNETGKIPAFYNVVPELNHNEMTGFDVRSSTKSLSSNFYFIFLKEGDDHPKILKRMKVLGRLYKRRGLPAETVKLRDHTKFYKIFSTTLLADWTAYYLAREYGVDPEHVPMVEEFKRLIT